jgi:lipopolysaccharide/colanic/teichoic acid biosynthesis glycosyltransferase
MQMQKTFYQLFKRIIDFTAACLLLFVLFPLFLVISLLVYIMMGRPIIFKQKRIGKNNQVFSIYKFRTLKNSDKNLLSDKDRLTTLGNILRKLSLDEIPQLFNIIKGDMSFIGPRPLLPEYLPFYTNAEKRRHQVVPGITGLAQVMGRNTLSWRKKFVYDIYYVRKMSLILDIKMVFWTIKTLVTPSQVNTKDNNFMPRLDDERKDNKL